MARLHAIAILVAVLAFSGAFASEPGEPLDCSDIVSLPPGYSCSVYSAHGQFPEWTTWMRGKGASLVTDNQGRLLTLQFRYIEQYGGSTTRTLARTSILRSDGQAEEIIGHIEDRTNGTARDHVRPVFSYDFPGGHGEAADLAGLTLEPLVFDAINGRLLIPLRMLCDPCGDPGYIERRVILSISGFATLFEILQGYTPQPAAIGFRVPYMPEGMPAADHFDTYWGTLTKPIDFTQAHPLACDYPAAAPHVGDYLTVADTVPTPPPGQGVYYLSSATYQGATRYGRKTTAGHLSGRDPAVLPTCVAASDGGAIPIDAPTTITQPGSYVLTRDISVNDGPAITINYASNVSLNLNGFQLERTGTGYDGAIAGEGNSIEIYGGRIVGGGVTLLCSYCTVRDLTVRDSTGGVFLEGNYNTVEHTRQFSSHIWLDDAVGGVVRDNVLQSGFIVIESGSGFQVTHNAITGGYIWLDGADNGVVLDNVVTGSSTHGMYGNGHSNRLAGNVVSESAGFGVYLELGFSDGTYSGNVLRVNHGTVCSNPTANADFCDEGTGNDSGGDNFAPDLR
jgi:hypothetical protein